MRLLLIVVVLSLAAIGCRTGTVDTLAVEKPDVEIDVAPRATPTAVAAAQVAEPTTESGAGQDDAEIDGDDDADRAGSEDDAGGGNAAPAEGAAPADSTSDSDDPAAAEPEPAEPEPAEPEAEDNQDAESEDDEYKQLAVGVAPISEDDDWCSAAAKLDANYQAVSSVDVTDQQALEAVFRQVDDSVETAASVAPEEISADMGIERWVWDRVVRLHAEADWRIADVAIDQVLELGEQNQAALLAVENYTARACG